MIIAKPRNMFSNVYDLTGDLPGKVELALSSLVSNATITMGENIYEVKNQKMFGTLLHFSLGEKLIATAGKPIFSTTYLISINDAEFELKPESIFTRSFVLWFKGKELGKVKPESMMGRGAKISFPDVVSLEFQLFLTAIVLLNWKAQAAAAAGG